MHQHFRSQTFLDIHTAKKQYRKFETNIPRKGIARLQSQFTFMFLWAIYILYSSDQSAYSAAGKYVSQAWEFRERSQIHECGNWDRGRAISFRGIHKFKFLQCSVQEDVALSPSHIIIRRRNILEETQSFSLSYNWLYPPPPSPPNQLA